MDSVFSKFSGLSDDDWVETLITSTRQPIIDGVEFPGFPSAELQATIVGSSNEQALKEAGVFYKHVKRLYRNLNRGDIADAAILDFGVGWGRYARMFARDVGFGQVYGVDVVPNMLDVCRQTRIPASLSLIAPSGQLPFRDEFVDIAYAYSVFTHLPERVAEHWINEIYRVTKPGGLLVMTVEPKRFITFCRGLTAENAASSPWYRGLRDVVARFPNAERDFDEGKFVYFPTGGGPQLPPDIYGDACISENYMRRAWADRFRIVDYVDDPNKFWQAAVALQRI